MNLKNRFAKLAEERISQRVLYVLIGIAALVFVLFFSVGFYAPFAENPAFNAPLLTDALIVFMWILLGLTVFCHAIVCVPYGEDNLREAACSERDSTYKITIAVFGTTFLCLVLSFLSVLPIRWS